MQVFNNGSVPASAQATFPYLFAVSKFLQVSPSDNAFNFSTCNFANYSVSVLIMPSDFSAMQPGNFDLVGTIVYEIDQHPYQSTFYNGTIEVVEAGAFLSMESVFLVTLGVALLVLLGIWIHGQIQHLSKVLQFFLVFFLYELKSTR